MNPLPPSPRLRPALALALILLLSAAAESAAPPARPAKPAFQRRNLTSEDQLRLHLSK